MALKPIPRLILIVAGVALAGFGAMNYADNKKTVAPAVAVDPPLQAIQTARIDGSLQSIVDKGVVRVGVQSPSKPFYSVEQGVSKGFNVDFMKLLFSQSEFTTKHPRIVIDTDAAVDAYEDVPKTLLKKDNRGNPLVHIAIDGLTFSDEDQAGVVYSIPYVSDFGYSLIASSTSAVKGVGDLKGLTVGVLKGDPDVKAYASNHFPGSKIVEVSDASIDGKRDWLARAIKSGAVDAMVYDYPFAVAEIADTNLLFVATKLPDSDIKYKIAVRKEDSSLLEAINVSIRKVKEMPQYADLLRQYFVSKNVASVAAARDSEVVYTVKTGDTLMTIAGAKLGNKMRYGEIEARNNLPNPNLIQVGQRLVLPKAKG